MNKITKRGFVPEDAAYFAPEAIIKMKKAAHEILFLLNRGYSVSKVSTFVGNHYLFSERQRMALVRSVSTDRETAARIRKQIRTPEPGAVLNIDGFNTIITLEVAFSGSPFFECMDGTVRDIAGLRGTYRLIDKTDPALSAIGSVLEKHRIKQANFYLDAPVSNSGRLGQRIRETFASAPFDTEVFVINHVDQVLCGLDHVVTHDSVILDHCGSWYNLVREVLEDKGLMDRAIRIW